VPWQSQNGAPTLAPSRCATKRSFGDPRDAKVLYETLGVDATITPLAAPSAHIRVADLLP
jgi:hypothetical protein